MKLDLVALTCVALGVILLIASVLWNSLLPNEAVWGEEQAVAYQEAATKFHNDTFDDSISKIELRASKEDYEARKQRLDRAVAAKHNTPGYLRIAGLISTGLGIVLIMVQRGNEG